jgi:hypothetical protein
MSTHKKHAGESQPQSEAVESKPKSTVESLEADFRDATVLLRECISQRHIVQNAISQEREKFLASPNDPQVAANLLELNKQLSGRVADESAQLNRLSDLEVQIALAKQPQS